MSPWNRGSINPDEPERIERVYVTMTLTAGQDTLRTRGWYSFDHIRHIVTLVVESNNASARFFAEHYGRVITVHAHGIPSDTN